MIRAFDSSNDKELWYYEMPTYSSSPPTIYQIDGKQYLFVTATGGPHKLQGERESSDTFIAFSLP
jgi:quinoprotein glucose dehydrogenase